MAKHRASRSETAGPVANFERWFSTHAVSRAKSDAERQDCRLGMIYEVFRRHPKVLQAKRQNFLMNLPGWNQSNFVKTPWLMNPWNATAFQHWEKPWQSATKGQSLSKLAKSRLADLTAWGTAGPEGVSMSVSELLSARSSETYRYIAQKPPMTVTVPDASGHKIESDVTRLRLEDNPELENRGWKLFAIDCRSRDAVKKALKGICENHVPARSNAHGRFTLKSWASRLCQWNEKCAGNFVGKRLIEVTDVRIVEMARAWNDFGMDNIHR
ncbi:MAG: hypothetical protein RL324_2035 [Verrucomicrobiota bacterium]